MKGGTGHHVHQPYRERKRGDKLIGEFQVVIRRSSIAPDEWVIIQKRLGGGTILDKFRTETATRWGLHFPCPGATRDVLPATLVKEKVSRRENVNSKKGGG